jgi:redox-sensitive bicupin YhaK (pirin superfamily)
MIRIVRSSERHFSDFGWLKTHWLFSFSDYWDPDNIHFGQLRAFNIDVVDPGTGYPMHKHREMEIITILIEGEITHRDNRGNISVIREGDVHAMSSGTGTSHSEFNQGHEPTKYLQIWIMPDEMNLESSFDQKNFSGQLWRNRLLPVASGQGFPDAVMFNTDASVYLSSIEAGNSIEFETDPKRRTFVYVGEGDVIVNGENLGENDQARIDLVDTINLSTKNGGKLVLVDIPCCIGFGYDAKTLKGAKGAYESPL